jgi:hypothetical protein
MRPLIEGATRPVSRVWTPGRQLNQGRTPRCVAYSLKGLLLAAPVCQPGPSPLTIYRGCQSFDGMPMPHDGSTIHGAAKWARAQGFYSNYVWARSADDLVGWVLLHGPAHIGINFYSGMETPDRHGIAHVTGSIVGGHALYIYGADRHAELVDVMNSWGGDDNFKLGFADLERLLHEDGEGCAPTELLKLRTVISSAATRSVSVLRGDVHLPGQV